MATRYWFSWNGTRSDTQGIVLKEPPQIVKPEERVDHITIPGRAGELTVTEGDDIWQSYIQTIPIAVQNAANIPTVENWLKGDGTVIFSSQPGLSQKARVIGAAELKKHSRNSDWWEAEVQFYCDPIKHNPSETAIEITTSGTSMTNAGDMTSYPLITVTGSGLITVSSGGNVLTIHDCTSGWVIDSENEWILENGVPKGGVCSGDFPVLVKGSNTVAFTGSVTKLTVTPRIRYL